jgi:hypothetical protein
MAIAAFRFVCFPIGTNHLEVLPEYVDVVFRLIVKMALETYTVLSQTINIDNGKRVLYLTSNSVWSYE